ncbi:hypothetical protein CC78DRAFT_242535 [Lojkania enalia]|uniref:Uncharacterized protein n=1 Tax=Lojkania enalia TaxID=147567 RepID=A0A9P4TQX9_9PLEO|nr:hypothetical protein CC78DRAFT_242535 [Didymosphaeria enalia]
MSSQAQPARPYARPAFPPLATTPSARSSAYNSYSSTSSLVSPSPASAAPLPSPTASHSHRQDFFGSLNQQQPSQQTQQSQQQNQTPQQPGNYHYQPNRDGAGRTAAETNNYLDQYSLVAEAAKRAQMAVLMRDVEGMEL